MQRHFFLLLQWETICSITLKNCRREMKFLPFQHIFWLFIKNYNEKESKTTITKSIMTELYWRFCTENIIRVRDTKLEYTAEQPRRYFLEEKKHKKLDEKFCRIRNWHFFLIFYKDSYKLTSNLRASISILLLLYHFSVYHWKKVFSSEPYKSRI